VTKPMLFTHAEADLFRRYFEQEYEREEMLTVYKLHCHKSAPSGAGDNHNLITPNLRSAEQ